MTSITEFLNRKAELDRRREKIATWHLTAHVNGGIELPWDAHEVWVNVDVWDFESNKVDAQKSLDALAKVVQYAVNLPGVSIEKKYDSSFTLVLKIEGDPDITIRYIASRDAVCTKRVVGTKFVPESITPAREEEIVEWECEPVSLLSREVEA